MKYIQKTIAPAEYLTWCQTQQTLGVNFNFKSLPNPEKRILHNALLSEQGFICGYTMKRINKDLSHIEHMKPQHICIQEGVGTDLNYFNLIACYPQKGMKANCRYGAQAKDAWWENNGRELLLPLNDSCELRVVFNLKGEISPTRIQTESTNNTISVLKLDDPILTEDRKNAIHEFIYGNNGYELISPEDANIAIDNVYKPTDDDHLNEFCIAIHDALYEYIDILKKISNNT
jgi:uncharacterized protein (TIGR02646 family)